MSSADESPKSQTKRKRAKPLKKKLFVAAETDFFDKSDGAVSYSNLLATSADLDLSLPEISVKSIDDVSEPLATISDNHANTAVMPATPASSLHKTPPKRKRSLTPPPVDQMKIFSRPSIAMILLENDHLDQLEGYELKPLEFTTLPPQQIQPSPKTPTEKITIKIHNLLPPNEAPLKPLKIKLFSSKTIASVFEEVSKRRNIHKQDVVLVYKDAQVFAAATPHSMGMGDKSEICNLD